MDFILQASLIFLILANYDIVITKIDSHGDTLWTNIIGNVNEYEQLVEIKATKDCGVLLALTTYLPYNTVLVKLDSIGNISWTKNIGPSANVYSFIEPKIQGLHLCT